MVPVLNDVGTMCAVFGNHDFGMLNFAGFFFFFVVSLAWKWASASADSKTIRPTTVCIATYDNAIDVEIFSDHGLEVLAKHTEKTNFPWLMSNVIGKPIPNSLK